jgi:hypothetical protein
MYGLATKEGNKLNQVDSLLKKILVGSHLCNSTPNINAELNSVDAGNLSHLVKIVLVLFEGNGLDRN